MLSSEVLSVLHLRFLFIDKFNEKFPANYCENHKKFLVCKRGTVTSVILQS